MPTTKASASVSASGSMSARVLRTLSLLGSVQAVTILCSVVRTKLVALWLGPIGIGLFGIFQGAVDMISNFARLGLDSSVTREVAATDDTDHRLRLFVVVRRIAIALGMLAGGITVACAPLLSLWAFGDTSHTVAFMLLALAVAASPLLVTELGVLQGLQRMRTVAKATLLGAILSLAISLPILWIWRDAGVVPSIITYSVVITVVNAIYGMCETRRLRSLAAAPRPSLSMHETFTRGYPVLRLGFYIALSTSLSLVASYIFLAWLNTHADTTTVGYFQAGNTLVNRYVGVIFTAMAIEYYPRLSSVANSRMRSQTFVSHEAWLMTCVLAVCVPLFIAIAPWLVRLLYTADFDTMLVMIDIGVTSAVLRGFSNALAYMILARADGRIYIVTEAISAATYVVLCILGWLTMGLTGLGIAFVLWYAIYTLAVWAVLRLRYNLRLHRAVWATLWCVCAACAVAVAATMLLPRLWCRAIAAAIAICAAATFGPALLKARKSHDIHQAGNTH